MSGPGFGMRAARLLDGWMRRHGLHCFNRECTRRATWTGLSANFCDDHRTPQSREFEFASLIRETEQMIAECNERPSCRVLAEEPKR